MKEFCIFSDVTTYNFSDATCCSHLVHKFAHPLCCYLQSIHWVDFQQHTGHTTFCENCSIGSDLKTTGHAHAHVRTHTHTHTHHSELHALTPTLTEWQDADFASQLFYDAASVSDYTVLIVGREINDQMARIWKVMVVTGTSMYYPSAFLGRLRKTTRSLNQDSTLTNIQTGHPPNKILQHYYYYSNVNGRVG